MGHDEVGLAPSEEVWVAASTIRHLHPSDLRDQMEHTQQSVLTLQQQYFFYIRNKYVTTRPSFSRDIKSFNNKNQTTQLRTCSDF